MRRLTRPGVFLLLFMVAACSAMPPIFQSDPVGASLYTIKESYESTIRSVGTAHIAGHLTDEQLMKFVGEARKFHASYMAILALHDARSLTDPDAKILALRKSLDSLQNLLQAMLIQRGAK